jgi:hypothetical protein
MYVRAAAVAVGVGAVSRGKPRARLLRPGALASTPFCLLLVAVGNNEWINTQPSKIVSALQQSSMCFFGQTVLNICLAISLHLDSSHERAVPLDRLFIVPSFSSETFTLKND